MKQFIPVTICSMIGAIGCAAVASRGVGVVMSGNLDKCDQSVNIGNVVIIPNSSDFGLQIGVVIKPTPQKARIAYNRHFGVGWQTSVIIANKVVDYQSMMVTTDPVHVQVAEAKAKGWLE